MKIGILGCGWLGLPLAQHLIQSGYTVKGSTTRTDKLELLKKHSIHPYLIRLAPELYCNDSSFWNLNTLIINIPPPRNRNDAERFYAAQIQALKKKITGSPISFVLFMSSTSVYPELSGMVTENNAIPGRAARASGNALLRAESLLSEQTSFDATIIRLGGLYGYDRNPARFLAGKKDLDRGRAPVNLIHRDDCVEIITQILAQNIRGEVLNAVSDEHPPRDVFYKAIAKVVNLTPPTFKKDENKPYKIVSNEKLKKKLNYQFKYPNPMDI